MRGQPEKSLQPGEWHFLRQVLLTSKLKEAMGGSFCGICYLLAVSAQKSV